MSLNLQLDQNEKEYLLYEGVDYRHFWEGAAKSQLDRLEKIILGEFLPETGHRLIDIGCGYGRLYPAYARRFTEIVLFDGSMSLLLDAKKHVPDNCILIAGDIYNMPFESSSFDTALFIRVLHHLSDYQKGISEITRITSRNGKLIFNYKNKLHPLSVFKWLLRKIDFNPFDRDPVGDITHLISYHPSFIEKVIRDLGYSNLKFRGSGVMDKVPWMSNMKNPWLNLGKILAPIFGQIKLAPWIFCSCINTGGSLLSPEKSFETLLCCPSCRVRVVKLRSGYICPTCRHIFPISEGIYDFRK